MQPPFEVLRTERFAAWFARLVDPVVRARISARIDRARFGHMGDVRHVGGGVAEMRIHAGPGYRLYFTRRGTAVILLLCGGDKSTQRTDIRDAISLAAALEDEA